MPAVLDQRPCGKTIVVVPCYNEAQRLDLPQFTALLSQDNDVSLLLVDDGSTDETPELLEGFRRRCPERVLVCGLQQNVGKAEAVRRGLQAALEHGPEFVGYWDADLATPLDAILQFRTLLAERPELLLVMGSRVALLGRQIKRRWIRHVLGRAFATVASFLLNLSVYDTQCGAKLFRVTSRTMELFERPFQTRWIFDVEILARLTYGTTPRGRYPVHEVVYEYPLDCWREVGGSRLKPQDMLWAGIELGGIYWSYARGPRRSAPTILRQPEIVPQPFAPTEPIGGMAVSDGREAA